MRALPVIGFILLVSSVDARAAPRSTRDPLPNREIERPETLPKGWMEVQGARDWNSRREGNGKVRYGFSRGSELWWTADVASADLAAPTVGWRALLGRNQAPAASAAAEVFYVSPRGTAAGLGLGVSGRHAWEGLLFSGRFEYVGRFAEGLGKPGDTVEASTDVLLQMGPLAASVMPLVRFVGPDEEDGLRVPNSEATATDVRWRLLAHPTRGVDVAGLFWASGERGLAVTVRY